jgi:hypothetical protein
MAAYRLGVGSVKARREEEFIAARCDAVSARSQNSIGG